jgi:probable phosphoglycerate mutase
MSILLIRHGETALNAARVVQPADTPLSERGAAQAAALARRLADFGVAAILSSDLARAAQTAAPLSELTGRVVNTSALLQERNFGELRGRAYDTLGFDPIRRDEAPAGGESTPDFERRVARAFDELARWRARIDGPLAVFTHGLVIRAMLQRHARFAGGTEPPERLANTSLTILSAGAPFTVELLNCASHLEGAAYGDDSRSLAGL